jgi:hypothetical protein
VSATAAWTDAVPVPVLELAACVASGADAGGVVGEWVADGGERLDAYVLPGHRLSMDVRFGDEPGAYLSPVGDQGKLAALLAKHRR